MKQNELFPKIRFKEFTNAWEQEKLGELVFYKTSSIILSNLNNNGKYCVYDANGIAGKIDIEPVSEEYISIIKDGAGAGRVRLLPKNTHILSTMGAILPLNTTDIKFVYFLLSKNSHLMKEASGSTIPHIYFKNYSQNIYIVPCNKEQYKISSLFSNLDSLITLHQRKYLALKNLKNTLLEKMFCDEKSKFPHIRFKEFTNAWEQWKVKDIFEITRGYVVSKKEILETKSGEYIYPIYSSQTINDGLLGYYKSYLASNAITWTTDGANAGTVSYRKGRFYATNVCGLLSTKAFTPNLYLAFALSSETYKHVAKVGNPKLMNNTMANIELIITSNLVEQSKISSLFSNLDSLITLHQRKLELLKNTKNTLLDKMFV
ncbi:restriction endonuclease subunit S [Mycoplasma feriruminatoris]|uniref:Restriction endonuclease subunit S n=1 Tax=Mycoplasma feriruminatoris TaxID=1179777 RepID=A0AAQ3DSY9_9MOLU|nr:restriction endonuclease subunit S [Mycoplasma feriruminatoris]WFQ95509.1 restriction endonuclease subunit S [Mycoplasma feriruminatoris]